jgi:hypothetical protein
LGAVFELLLEGDESVHPFRIFRHTSTVANCLLSLSSL